MKNGCSKSMGEDKIGDEITEKTKVKITYNIYDLVKDIVKDKTRKID